MSDKLSNSCDAQRQRLLDALETAGPQGVTSYVASRSLEIYHPPARVKELRQSGYDIKRLWETIETETARPRRVGRYVLISRPFKGGADE